MTEPRALLPARQWRISAAAADLLNEDDKRIGELAIEQHYGLDEQSTTTVSLWAERGYGTEARAVFEQLRGDLRLEPLPMAVNAWMSERCAPGEALLPPREPPKLRGHQSTREALAALLAHYHQLMLDQEPGTLNDTDIEFLHEFRVSMRRARSVATAFASHAPGLGPLCRELGWLNAATGRLRDLDVWLYDLRSSPTEANAALGDYLLEHRTREFVRVRTTLSTKRYARFNERFERWIDAQREAHPRGMLISDAARGAIGLRYAKMRKRFARYARRPDYDTLHALRKDGKKLRYLLGACVGLLPKSKSAALLEDLKRFQTGVGQICDRHARAALIEHYLSANPEPRVREILEQTLEHQAPDELTALRPAQARKLERSMARLSGRHGERIVARLTAGSD